jgi:hypothetical protein
MTPAELLSRLEQFAAQMREIEARYGSDRQAAIQRSGLPPDLIEAVLVNSALPSEPRQSTMTGTEMTSAELKKLPGEQRRRLGIAKAQSNDHPFPRALYRDGKTVTSWAAKRKLNRNIVKAWFAKGDAVRPIPKSWAEEIARDYPDVPAVIETWRGGIV